MTVNFKPSQWKSLPPADRCFGGALPSYLVTQAPQDCPEVGSVAQCFSTFPSQAPLSDKVTEFLKEGINKQYSGGAGSPPYTASGGGTRLPPNW